MALLLNVEFYQIWLISLFDAYLYFAEVYLN